MLWIRQDVSVTKVANYPEQSHKESFWLWKARFIQHVITAGVIWSNKHPNIISILNQVIYQELTDRATA